MSRASRLAPGFTIVELIMVIVLLGILSVVSIARGGRTGGTEPRLFASTAAEQYRFAHGLSTGRFGDQITFSITNSTDGWQFVTASAAEGEVRREDMTTTVPTLVIKNGSASAAVSNANTLRIEFSSTGDLSTAAVGTLSLQTNLGIELRIAGDSAHDLCVYPTGYLSTGSCE